MTLRELAAAHPDGPRADSLRVYANRGVLPAEKIGRDWFMEPDAYRSWLESRNAAPSPLPPQEHE